MRRALFVVIVCLAIGGEVPAGGGNTLFESEGMRGVQAPFLGSFAIRDVRGAGAPWIIHRSDVRIREDGRLKVRVKGLVLDPATVPPPRGGTNPVADFRAVVSCIDGVDMDQPTFTNIVTETFPADEEGNARLDTMIELPDPCFGIIVFVTSPGESWFAATGLSRADGEED